jgi:hypothetical protein
MTRQNKIILYSGLAFTGALYFTFRSLKRTQSFDDLLILINRSGGSASINKNKTALLGQYHTDVKQSNPNKGFIMLSNAKVKQIAKKLEDALSGGGTDESLLSSALSSLKDKVAVSQVAYYYKNAYGSTLFDDLKDDLSDSEYRAIVTQRLISIPDVRWA